MTITLDPWSSPTHPTHKLTSLPFPLLTTLSSSNLKTAQTLSPYPLSEYLVSEECVHVWKMRKEQILRDEEEGVWFTRLVVWDGIVVGRAGFHGVPDVDGRLEVGYSIDPQYRRKGHARAALEILLYVARGDERVKIVRASVRPDNVESRALIDQCGFEIVGEQWDEIDGLEIVLEVGVEGSKVMRNKTDKVSI